MVFQTLVPSILLLGIPIIFLMYLLKPKAKPYAFSSLMFWREWIQNIESASFSKKFRDNLLMYLQMLLLALLVFAMLSPAIRRGSKSLQQVVFVVDTSASMCHLYDDKQTRLDYAKQSIAKQIDALDDNATITILSCAGEGRQVYQGNSAQTAKQKLSSIQPTMESGTLDLCAPLVHSVLTDMEEVAVICFTDTSFDSTSFTQNHEKAVLSVTSTYSQGENCAMSYINYKMEKEKMTVLCKLVNYGTQDSTFDVSLYADSTILDVQEVSLQGQESKTIYFETIDVPKEDAFLLSASINHPDALPEDNKQSIVAAPHTNGKVLLLSKGNVFLEKALAANDQLTVDKADSFDILEHSEQVYDLYVVDDVALPNDKTLSDLRLLLPPTSSLLCFQMGEALNDGELDSACLGAVEQTFLSFGETPMTQYIEDFSFGVTKSYYYKTPADSIPFLMDSNGNVCGFFCETKPSFAVLGFDIHDSDIALQPEFPIFIHQLASQLLGNSNALLQPQNFPTALESMVQPQEDILGDTEALLGYGSLELRKWILLLCLALLILEWIFYLRQSRPVHKLQYQILRSVLMLLVLLAILPISLPRKQDNAQTIFLVDLSDSMNKNQSAIETYLKKTMEAMPDKNTAGVVVFGGNTRIDTFLSERASFGSFSAQPVTTATNLEQALGNAANMFDEDVGKQIVLLTDGYENEGNASLAVAKLIQNDIRLKVVEMEALYQSTEEVYLEKLLLPEKVHANDRYTITAVIQSNTETDARLSLYSAKTLLEEQTIHITKGENRFVFEQTAGEEVFASYKAVIEPLADSIAVNNSYTAFTEVVAPMKVLLIANSAKESKEFEYLLKLANVGYDRYSPSGVPVQLSQLNNYQAVITLNIHYDDLRNGFPTALQTYVKDYAGAYLCIGGDNSYALGAYQNTPLEEILPVQMHLTGEKEIPKMAMVMVIDHSGSMLSPSAENTTITGLDLAKQAALAGAKEVRPTDDLGVLAFDDSFSWYVPVQEAKDMDAISNAIETIGPGGGTSIYPALQEAYNKIRESDASIKHIILLTDGQDGFREFEDLTTKMNEEQITLSTVAVGGGADQLMLQALAQTCKGRYYYTDISNSIPRIFSQEVYLSTETYLINEPFLPIADETHKIFSNIPLDTMPTMYGYIASTLKPTATPLLVSHKGDPILSTMRYGLGHTMAWNSDATNQWTQEYATFEAYPQLWANMISYIVSDTSAGEDSYEVVKTSDGVRLRYHSASDDANTSVSALITDEEGKTTEISLEESAPDTFTNLLSLSEAGVYSISFQKSSGGGEKRVINTAFANQYSMEYQFSNSMRSLETLIKQTNATRIDMQTPIWDVQMGTVRQRLDLTLPFLVLAWLLWLIDIAMRRFHLQFRFKN